MGQGCKAVKSNTDVLFKINLGWLCSLCTPICWENRQTDSANCRPFRLSPVFVILKCPSKLFYHLCYTPIYGCRKHSLYRFRGTSMPSRLPPQPEPYIGFFGADGGGRTHTMLPSRDFESRASANSTTSANYPIIIP